MRKLFVRSTLLLCLAGCASSAASDYPYAKEPNPRTSEYVIGVSDRLRITVWKNPELNTEIQVRPDGTITMPLIGDVNADGLTPTELKGKITEKLSAFIKEQSATVSVAVTEVASYRVTVSGSVVTPGVFTSKQYLTVADAIALAGGPNRFGSPDQAVIIRRDKRGNVRRIPVNYTEIVQGKNLEQNLYLIAGDTVFIP